MISQFPCTFVKVILREIKTENWNSLSSSGVASHVTHKKLRFLGTCFTLNQTIGSSTAQNLSWHLAGCKSPKWLLLHPAASPRRLKFSSEQGDFHSLPLRKIIIPAMGHFKSVLTISLEQTWGTPCLAFWPNMKFRIWWSRALLLPPFLPQFLPLPHAVPPTLHPDTTYHQLVPLGEPAGLPSDAGPTLMAPPLWVPQMFLTANFWHLVLALEFNISSATN